MSIVTPRPRVSRRSFVAGLAGSLALMPGLIAAQDGLKGGSRDDDRQDEDIDPDLIEIGVVSDGHYVSPQFGYRIDWEPTWAIELDTPGESNLVEEYDALQIGWSPNGAITEALIDFNGFQSNSRDALVFMDRMQTDSVLAEILGDGYEIAVADMIRTDSALEVALRAIDKEDPDSVMVMILVYRLLASETLVLSSTLIDELELTADVASSLASEVELDREPLLQELTAESILDGLAALESLRDTSR